MAGAGGTSPVAASDSGYTTRMSDTLAPPRPRHAATPAPVPQTVPAPAGSDARKVPRTDPAPGPPDPPCRLAVTIPADARTFEGFRRWTRSEQFPEFGRIDYLAGDLFIDLMPERVDAHNLPKTEITRVVGNHVARTGAGSVFADGVRYALAGAIASFEPDLSYVSDATFEEGRIERMPTVDGEDTIEFAGPPDLVVEIVSPSSVAKDTDRLPAECFAGGVAEYWLVNCLGEIGFTIHSRGAEAFKAVEPDADGFAASAVLGARYRLARSASPVGGWRYRLEER